MNHSRVFIFITISVAGLRKGASLLSRFSQDIEISPVYRYVRNFVSCFASTSQQNSQKFLKNLRISG